MKKKTRDNVLNVKKYFLTVLYIITCTKVKVFLPKYNVSVQVPPAINLRSFCTNKHNLK